jgi:hypothetical protein
VLAPKETAPFPPKEGRPGRQPGVPSGRWTRLALYAAGAWLATRVAYVLFTYVSVAFAATGTTPARTFLEAWDQYDTHWYLLISRNGYFEPTTSAFMPLYPAVIGAVSALLGDAHGPVWPAFDLVRLIVALAVANAGTLLAFVGLALLAAHEYREKQAASATLWAVAAYPFAFFLAAAYSDGPFLAAAVFALYFGRRGRWSWAAVAAFTAGLLRPTAVALILPLLWEYGRQYGWWSRAALGRWRNHLRELPRGLLTAGSVPLALALYGLFLWWRFGSPLAWFVVQSEQWHRVSLPLWRTAHGLVGRLFTYPPLGAAEVQLLLNLVPLLITLTVIVLSYRRMPLAYVLYLLGLCYLCVSAPVLSTSELIESTGRFLLAAIPVFLVVGRWTITRPAIGYLWISSGFLVQGALLTYFFAGRWIA